jgi:ABC-type nitrate/sulfonate/bicarbonate transport system substrate-binding protein
LKRKFHLALDWTPNVNHIGFLVGLEKGFYKELAIQLEIINPEDDNYKETPAKR